MPIAGPLDGSGIVHEEEGLKAEANLTSSLHSMEKLVDVTGFEPATPCLQIQKANMDGEKENE